MRDSGAIIVAGVLFMISGFFTDILADPPFVLPASRRLFWRGVSFGMRGRKSTIEARTWQEPPPKPQRAGDVIDVEFTEVPKERDNGEGDGGRKELPWGEILTALQRANARSR